MGYKFRASNKARWSKEYPDDQLKPALRARLLPHRGPFRISEVFGPPGPERTRSEAVQRVDTRMRKGQVGDVLQVTNPKGWFVRVRKTPSGIDRESPPWANTYLKACNDRIVAVAEAAYAHDHGVDCLGTKVCKRILGSSSWSQHAYGNAIDLAFAVPPPVGFDLKRQDALVNYLVAHADELAIYHAIHRNRAWTRGSGWGFYGGVYHTHVHIDCDPQGTGWPPGC